MLSWLRRLLGVRRHEEKSSQETNGSGEPTGLDSERIEAARQRLKESIPPPAEADSDA